MITVDETLPPGVILTDSTAYFSRTEAVKTIESDTNSAPPQIQPYEKAPDVIRIAEPRCPDAARQRSLSGSARVKLWVDKQGNVRKAILLEATDSVFIRSALLAALQWKFTPAYMSKGPISVWVSIPIRFRDCQ
jgi:TonB family protein